jgi:hypothetical protein
MMQAWADYLDAPRSAHDTQRSTALFSRIASTHLVPEQTGVYAPQLSACGNQALATASCGSSQVQSSQKRCQSPGKAVSARAARTAGRY